jgi:hypothetical protein
MNGTRSSPDRFRAYRRYPKLYAEQKYATAEPSHRFRFLDLPPELRVMVYKILLVLPHPVELWPECDVPLASHQNIIVHRNLQYLKQKLNSRKINVGLLRTCKLINYEARHVFYGCNEWKCSGLNGWMVANAFLYTIGRENIKCIRSITLPMPFKFHLAKPFPIHGAPMPAVSSKAVLRLAKQIPFEIPAGWEYVPSFYEVCAALSTHCRDLRALNLVLPAWYLPSLIDVVSKKKMLDRLVGLQGHMAATQGHLTRPLSIISIRVSKVNRVLQAYSHAISWEPDERQQPLVQEFITRGWQIKQTTCDKHGRYATTD